MTWTKPARPEWMDEETYAQVPDELEVRELRFKVQQPGFRVNELVLVTTMLDAEEYTKEELADLFLQRWNIELDLRSIKDVLQMDVLRCKTPEMVEKEIWMHLLAYNLIRGVMAKAAEAHDKQPRRLELQGALADDDGVPGRVAMGDASGTGERLVSRRCSKRSRTTVSATAPAASNRVPTNADPSPETSYGTAQQARKRLLQEA